METELVLVVKVSAANKLLTIRNEQTAIPANWA
jgi:hypothetical protein